jgi:RimJ/RimL family protein N-acetyltransferase
MIGLKCYLSPLSIEDAEKCTEWNNDLEVTINLGRYSNSSNLNTEKQKLSESGDAHDYGIIDKEIDELIGDCGFFDMDNINQTAEAGILIGNKKYWGKGYGTEALTLLLDYGFKALNLNNILIRVYSFNGRARKCYEKSGFKIIGKRRESLLRGKETFDVIYMDILYKEFYENNKIIIEINDGKTTIGGKQ